VGCQLAAEFASTPMPPHDLIRALAIGRASTILAFQIALALVLRSLMTPSSRPRSSG